MQVSCPVDCACGDGVCDVHVGETHSTCPQDCTCGNHICEDWCTALQLEARYPGDWSPNDIKSSCNETTSSCGIDCHCGDGVCDPLDWDETPETCHADCFCGDGVCSTPIENWLSCEVDCDAVCGNGALERGEQCDDGNADGGDGCDANCLNEAVEIEVGAEIEAAIDVAAEEDVYTFTAPADGNFTVSTSGDNDTKCWLDDADGVEIAYNDDGGEGLNCSITEALTAGSQYRVRVRFFSNQLTGPYTVRVVAE